eukprot:COSAG02_NODE_36617_length_452_cov_1.209632_1_plen_35_part_10
MFSSPIIIGLAQAHFPVSQMRLIIAAKRYSVAGKV